MTRSARQKKTLLVNADMYTEKIRPGINLLQSVRTPKQFVKLATVISEHWAAQGEEAYANWLTEVYLAERWNPLNINGAGVGGALPSQQGIESHHSAIKKTCVPSSRSSTNGVLRGILPRIMRNDGENLCPDRFAQFAEGLVPPEMMAKTEILVGNYRLIHKGRECHKRLEVVLFNVSKHIVRGQGPTSTMIEQPSFLITQWAFPSWDQTRRVGVRAALAAQNIDETAKLPPLHFSFYPCGLLRVSSTCEAFNSVPARDLFARVGCARTFWRCCRSRIS